MGARLNSITLPVWFHTAVACDEADVLTNIHASAPDIGRALELALRLPSNPPMRIVAHTELAPSSVPDVLGLGGGADLQAGMIALGLSVSEIVASPCRTSESEEIDFTVKAGADGRRGLPSTAE